MQFLRVYTYTGPSGHEHGCSRQVRSEYRGMLVSVRRAKQNVTTAELMSRSQGCCEFTISQSELPCD